MAQRNSAPADASGAASDAGPSGAAAGPTGAGAERRRAAAYLDLWERQLRIAASDAPVRPGGPRKGRAAGA